MRYEGRKITFIVLSIVFGCCVPAAIVSLVNGYVPVGLFFLCLDASFVALAIYYGRKCKFYWSPKEIKEIEAGPNFIVPRKIYEYIDTNFPELRNHKNFDFSDPLLTTLHLECKKLKPTQLTIYKVAEKVWDVFNSDKKCPEVYLVAEDIYNSGNTAGLSTEGFGERSIVIKFEPGFNVDTILMLMVHEMAHTYQKDKGFADDNVFIEAVTDCFAVFLGFEKQFIYGRDTQYQRREGNYTFIKKNHIGYVKNDVFQQVYWLFKNNKKDYLSKDNQELKISILKTNYLIFSTGIEMHRKMCSVMNTNFATPSKKEKAQIYLSFLDKLQIEFLKKTYNETINEFNEEDYEQMIEIFIVEKLLFDQFSDELK